LTTPHKKSVFGTAPPAETPCGNAGRPLPRPALAPVQNVQSSWINAKGPINISTRKHTPPGSHASESAALPGIVRIAEQAENCHRRFRS
jgi:hypothetical protein